MGDDYIIDSIMKSAAKILLPIFLALFLLALFSAYCYRIDHSGIDQNVALGDVMTVQTYQSAYADVTRGGYAGELSCLLEPRLCLPEWPEDTEWPSTGAGSFRINRSGRYVFFLHPGEPRTDLGAASPEHPLAVVAIYAIVAVPDRLFQSRTSFRYRGFCGDSSGRICLHA